MAVVTFAAASCTPASTPPSTARPAPTAPSKTLTDYVPAAGLRWLVVGSPRDLARSVSTDALRLFFPPRRVAVFTDSTGVDLERTGQALAAGFDFGTLYAVSADGFAGQPDEAFATRVVGGPRSLSEREGVLRLTGVIGTTPQAAVLLDGTLFAVAVGDTSLARVVEAYATGRLTRSPTVMLGAALRSLDTNLPGQAHFYAPGPFQDEWSGGARGLLAATEAIGIHAEVRGAELWLEVEAAGRWRARDAQLALDTWSDVAHSDVGRMLGFDRPRVPAAALHTPRSLRLRVSVDLSSMVVGLHSLVAAEVEQLMSAPATGTAPSEPVPK